MKKKTEAGKKIIQGKLAQWLSNFSSIGIT